MNKDDLLKHIAESAYNVGFGAKTHFATFDIVEKAPGFIGFTSMGVGIFALFIDELSTKHISATFILLGLVGLYISFYNDKKEAYAKAGTSLTQLFNALKELYATVKSCDNGALEKHQGELKAIEDKFYSTSIEKQILFSDWYAHYKFFWQHQIKWVDEQLQFKFWRDKVPLSFIIALVLTLIFLVMYFFVPTLTGLIHTWMNCNVSNNS